MHVLIGIIFLLGLDTSLAANDTHTTIMAAIDVVFKSLDHNNNGIMELSEFENSYAILDTNHDNEITEAEYSAGSPNHAFAAIVFKELDYDHKGYLDRSEVYGQFSVMDTSADNEVSRSEFDRYFTKLVESAIQHYYYLLGTTNSPPAIH